MNLPHPGYMSQFQKDKEAAFLKADAACRPVINHYTLLDHGYVNIIESWGSDERIIEAARMSTNKGFLGWGPDGEGKPGDEKLLRFLYEHKHATPFEMAGLVIEVQAPIMVFREWHRHRTQSYNEMSARYTQLPDLFYVPAPERITAQSKTNKQASGVEGLPPDVVQMFRDDLITTQQDAYVRYERAIKTGIPRELARLHLPVSIYSRMRASANLRNWLAFLTLRMDAGAQWEIRQYAIAVADIVRLRFPRTFELFNEGKS